MSLFTDHPASVDETYGEHMMFAWRFSFRLFKACAKAFLPAKPQFSKVPV